MAYYKSYNTLMSEARQKVQDEFGVGENNCVSLDLLLRKLGDRIASETKKPTPDKQYLTAIIEFRSAMQYQFDTNRCLDKIEKSKQIESALLLTKSAIKDELSVDTKSNVEQKIYIGVGALVLLVGLYIISKK